jgi:hypothetical protein
MTDEAWSGGMAKLLLAFPMGDEAPGIKSERGRLYRDALDGLTDAQWVYAVRSAIEQEKFFPPVARLRELAVGCPPPSHFYLPTPKVGTDEERRAGIRRGVAEIRAALAEVGVAVPSSESSEPGTTR